VTATHGFGVENTKPKVHFLRVVELQGDANRIKNSGLHKNVFFSKLMSTK
jgi:hypothetical protein